MRQGVAERFALGRGGIWLLGLAVLAWALIGLYLFHWGATWALDLRVYRAAGHALYHDGAPYSSLFTANRLPFTYPPFALLVLSPLSVGPLGLTKALWWGLNEAALIAIVYLLLSVAWTMSKRRSLVIAVAASAVGTLAFEPLRSNLDYGQINLLLMLLVVVDITRVRGRARGLCVGVAAAIKLTPLLYLAYFVIDRDRRSALRGTATFFVLTALSWLILPTASTHYWLHEAFTPSRTGPVGSVSNQSWNGVAHRAPFHGGAAGVVLWILASLVTLSVGILAARWLAEGRRVIDALLALALCEVMVSPISWSHHWSWVIVIPIVLVARWGEGDRVLNVALLGLALVAVAEPYWWSLHGWFGDLCADSLTLMGAFALVALFRRARRLHRAEGSELAVAERPELAAGDRDRSGAPARPGIQPS
jgi:alpha-1,2-mannosyltransferase